MGIKDLVIIGGGPIGMACGIAAQNAGLDYLIIEKGALANSIFHYPLNMKFFSTSERLEIGDIPFTCTQPKPGREEALEYYRRVALQYRLLIHLYEEVQSAARIENNQFQVHTNKAAYRTRNIIIATGFYDLPNYMDIPGESLPKVHHYYKEPHGYAFQNVLVVGAQNSAVDAALEIWRKGARVTMVIRGREIGPRVKYWIRPDIQNRIAEGSIKAYFESTVTEISEKQVTLQTPGGRVSLENDFVLAMTGYLPNISLLKKLGVNLSEDQRCCPQYDPETMETNIPGIFLAGVICGGRETHKWFIENSREHAPLIIRKILKQAEKANRIL